MNRALITGVTGQDGSYLAELLLGKGYEVHGLVRRTSTSNRERILGLDIVTHDGDMCDAQSLDRLVAAVRPTEVYNLAAQSHVGVSFRVPVHTADVVALGTVRLLEAVRLHAPEARFYQASSSEVFGNAPCPQSESTPLLPRNPYAAAKAFGLHISRNYREAYGMHVSNGILFNHESERRGERFVTRKITRAVGRIAMGLQDTLRLGNLDSRRDWGHAADYVDAMWRMLQQPEPDDYVVATGISHSVRDFCELAFGHAGLSMTDHVELDPAFMRPADVDDLVGDASKARRVLGWTATHDFEALVRRMVEHDLALARTEACT